MKKIDLSWNSIGSGKEGVIGNELGKALAYENVAHLDISFNKLTKADLLKLGEYIKTNKMLLGLHIMGNDECYLDS